MDVSPDQVAGVAVAGGPGSAGTLDGVAAAFGMAAIVTILFNTLLAWIKDAFDPLNDVMALLTGHHWITHGLFDVGRVPRGRLRAVAAWLSNIGQRARPRPDGRCHRRRRRPHAVVRAVLSRMAATRPGVSSSTTRCRHRRQPRGETAMKPKIVAIMAALAAVAAAGPVNAQATHEIPQSIQMDHADTLAQLTELAKRPAPVGPIAEKALEMVKRHIQRENEYILPPLTLLAALAEGKVTNEMRWAIEMADKVKANREDIFIEHSRITDIMSALLSAAETAGDTEAADAAKAMVAGSLGDMEVEEPTTMLIGEYLRSRLQPAP